MEHKSEVARIREQIVREYQAAQQIFDGFTPTAKHEFLTKRQENLGMYLEELKKHTSPEEAMQIFMQIGQNLQKKCFCIAVGIQKHPKRHLPSKEQIQ